MNQVNNVRDIKKIKQNKMNIEEVKEKDPAKILEDKWNSRFYLEKVPGYDSMTDCFCAVHKPKLKNISPSTFKNITEELLKIKKNADANTNKDNNINLNLNNYNNNPSKRIMSAKNYGHKKISLNDNTKHLKDIKFTGAKKYREKTNEIYCEQFTKIKNMWELLGVNNDFKRKFISFARTLTSESIKDYYNYEISNLTKYNDILTKLGNEIITRENTLTALKLSIDTITELLNDNKEIDSVVTDIYTILSNLRILSVNIVIYFMKFWEVAGYYVLNGKYEIEKVNKVFGFDKNYLVKMKSDTDFLYDSILFDFFNFSSESDPFLVALSKDLEKTDKLVIPIDEEGLSTIKNCQFYMHSDIVCNELIERKNELNVTIRSRSNSATKFDTTFSPNTYTYTYTNPNTNYDIKVMNTMLNFRKLKHRTHYPNSNTNSNTNTNTKANKNNPRSNKSSKNNKIFLKTNTNKTNANTKKSPKKNNKEEDKYSDLIQKQNEEITLKSKVLLKDLNKHETKHDKENTLKIIKEEKATDIFNSNSNVKNNTDLQNDSNNSHNNSNKESDKNILRKSSSKLLQERFFKDKDINADNEILNTISNAGDDKFIDNYNKYIYTHQNLVTENNDKEIKKREDDFNLDTNNSRHSLSSRDLEMKR